MKKQYVVDSTVLIHVLPNNLEYFSNKNFIVPSSIYEEIKSKKAKFALEILIEQNHVQLVEPTKKSLKKAEKMAKKTGDFTSLSNYDLQIIALSLDYNDFIILSDDFAIQNVCKINNLCVEGTSFSIQTKRQYYWKCSVCYNTYHRKVQVCIECGSPVKRKYYKKK